MYAVIGAGPMGLAAARNLQKLNIPFVGFELHTDVGGLSYIDNPHSTMYENAHLISSKRMTEFKEFPMSDSVAAYP
ncbi:NAD(P)-binding protein, partial [Cobetia sp. SIMBA_158]|uniref:NAD(P)-binding protein n=1 Tax=Cobetia sp. SIMBA_158 TaxID=3081617 RepID=UPI003980FAE6